MLASDCVAIAPFAVCCASLPKAGHAGPSTGAIGGGAGGSPPPPPPPPQFTAAATAKAVANSRRERDMDIGMAARLGSDEWAILHKRGGCRNAWPPACLSPRQP